MQTKTFEIRDRATFMPALAVKLSPDCPSDLYLLRRAGFGTEAMALGDYILLYFLAVGGAEYDPHAWPQGSRTRRDAHLYIREHFETLASGSVIDVEFINGERTEPKTSEMFETL